MTRINEQIFPVVVPNIRTDRLFLTALQSKHFEGFASMDEDPEVMRYILDGKTQSRSDSWRRMAELIGHWQLRGFGIWAVEEWETGVFLGWVGFFQPEGRPRVDFGWRFLRAGWGRGYATEAAKAAIQYASTHGPLVNVTSIIHPDNLASIQVAKKLGAQYDKTIDFLGTPNACYVYPQFFSVSGL